jgi:hypothetical protein
MQFNADLILKEKNRRLPLMWPENRRFSISLLKSIPNTKTGKLAGIWFPRDVDIINTRSGRALPAPLNNGIYQSPFPLENSFNGTILFIFHPT